MHEHGHGVGLNHVESNNARFLMEPFLQTNFDGLQFDDILGAQRAYGDFYEKSNGGAGNDTAATATDLGFIDDGLTAAMGLDARDVLIGSNDVDFLSIDDNSDTDFFSFTIDNPADVDISVLPVGPTYLQGPQGGGQSNYVTSQFSDLNLALFDSDQSTLLTSDNSGGLGQADMINGWSLSQPGEYYVRVQGTANNIQMYEISVSVTETGRLIDGDFNDDGFFDCADVDSLVGDIAAMSNTPDFDLTGDGVVNTDDLTQWLAEAGAVNLASGNPYLPGDATLDGVVDVSDFNVFNTNKFTLNAAWCKGDFDANGVIDVSDFNIFNNNRFSMSDVASVPEPTSAAVLVLGLMGVVSWSRSRR